MYNETFSQIAKMVIVKTLLVVAAAKGWSFHPSLGRYLHETSSRFPYYLA